MGTTADAYRWGLYDGVWFKHLITTSFHDTEPLFCLPKDFHLNRENVASIIDKAIEDFGDTDSSDKRFSISLDDPLVKVLFIGLQDTFPCN